MFNKKNILTGLVLLGTLVILPATSLAQAAPDVVIPITINMVVPDSLAFVANCDGGGGTTVTLIWNAGTLIGAGSCATVTVTWLQAIGADVRLAAVLTTPLTDGVTPILAANHSVKITGNAFGDIFSQTAFAAFPVNLWQENIAGGQQNRNDAFSVDFQIDVSGQADFNPGNYTGTVTLTASVF